MLADSTVQAGYVLLDLKFICKRQIQTVCLPEKRFSGQGTAQAGQPRSLLNRVFRSALMFCCSVVFTETK